MAMAVKKRMNETGYPHYTKLHAQGMVTSDPLPLSRKKLSWTLTVEGGDRGYPTELQIISSAKLGTPVQGDIVSVTAKIVAASTIEPNLYSIEAKDLAILHRPLQ